MSSFDENYLIDTLKEQTQQDIFELERLKKGIVNLERCLKKKHEKKNQISKQIMDLNKQLEVLDKDIDAVKKNISKNQDKIKKKECILNFMSNQLEIKSQTQNTLFYSSDQSSIDCSDEQYLQRIPLDELNGSAYKKEIQNESNQTNDSQTHLEKSENLTENLNKTQIEVFFKQLTSHDQLCTDRDKLAIEEQHTCKDKIFSRKKLLNEEADASSNSDQKKIKYEISKHDKKKSPIPKNTKSRKK